MLTFGGMGTMMSVSHVRKISLLLAFTAITSCGGSNNTQPATNNASNPTIVAPPPAESGLTFSKRTESFGLSHSAEFSETYDEMPSQFGGGAASGDIDGDGDIDVFVTRGDTQSNLLFINENGQFTEVAENRGLAFPKNGTENYKLSGPSFADIDGDGDLDLFIGGLQGDPSLLFQNNGQGSFTDVTQGSGLDLMTSKNTLSVDFGDYDKDGDLDLAMAHWGTPRDRLSPGETETLWRNDSTAAQIQFTAVSAAAGISDELDLDIDGVLGVNYDYTFSPNFSDINDDGFLDLLSVGDFTGSQVFMNNQDGTFSNVTDKTQISDSNGMGSAVGDYDNDGDNDWFVSSIDGNRLYENMDGTLIDVSAEAGIISGSWGWGSCFADFDADGHLDIFQTNGWVNNSGSNPNEPYTEDLSRLWISDSEGQFFNKADDFNIIDTKQGRGVICSDFDDDMDVDVLLLINNDTEGAILWENELTDSNAIIIKVTGPSPNTDAIGAKILLKTGDLTQMRDVTIGSNFTSHNPSRQFFGLGDMSMIDELTITWPDGTQSIQTNVNANQVLNIIYPN